MSPVAKPAMLLLDTHLVLWSALDPGRLSAKARRILQSRESPLAFSLVTLWEVAIKTSLGRPDFMVDPRRLHDGLLTAGFQEIQILAGHLVRVASLPWVHRDPFDRLLVAQAMDERITLLTVDSTLAGYGRSVRVV